MIKPMAMEFTVTQMGQDMKEIGVMICSMALVKKNGLMVLDIQDITSMALKLA